jgi:hypothetical protein
VRRRLLTCPALDLRTATRTTPREATALLAMIWRGEAGLAASANGVSWLLGQQFCHARMAGAFPFPPWVGAGLAPVVVGPPVAHQRLQLGQRHALGLVRDRLPVGPPRPRHASAQIGQVLFRNVDREGADCTVVGHGIPFLGLMNVALDLHAHALSASVPDAVAATLAGCGPTPPANRGTGRRGNGQSEFSSSAQLMTERARDERPGGCERGRV